MSEKKTYPRGSGARPIGRYAPQPPAHPLADWALWAHMPKAKVREAVLLSLGLEPRPALTSIPYAEPGREFERRLTIAAAHIHQAGPLRPLEPSDTLGSLYAVTVSLPEFGVWARAMGWTLPEQFPALEAAQPPLARPGTSHGVASGDGKAKTIVFPAGTEHVSFGDLAQLISDVLHPDAETYASAIRNLAARDELKRQLRRAVETGELPLKSPLTFLPPIDFPIGEALNRAKVSISDLSRFVSGMGLKVELETPAPKAEAPAGGASGGDAWMAKARARAFEIIERQRQRDLYPSQMDVADEIAKEFRVNQITGAGGKPLTGAYIKRHALRGISSAEGKQVSTSIRRGK